MKTPVLVALIMLMTCLSLTAQTGSSRGQRPESEYYYVTVPVERVYSYHLGYIVVYRKGPMGMGQTYLPIEWFDGAANKGEFVTLTAPGAWPYLAIYYRNGEFHHVKLAVRNRAHVSWGMLPRRQDIDSNFEGIEAIQIEFQ